MFTKAKFLLAGIAIGALAVSAVVIQIDKCMKLAEEKKKKDVGSDGNDCCKDCECGSSGCCSDCDIFKTDDEIAYQECVDNLPDDFFTEEGPLPFEDPFDDCESVSEECDTCEESAETPIEGNTETSETAEDQSVSSEDMNSEDMQLDEVKTDAETSARKGKKSSKK